MENKLVKGGVWVACSERLPERHHGDASGEVLAKSDTDEFDTLYYRHFIPDGCFQYWLDTTVEIVTKADHDAAIAKLHKEFGCELRDPNGTIWQHAATLQEENEALKKQIAALNATVARLENAIRDFNEDW